MEELPEEYQEYREQIETLRGYGLGLEKKTVDTEIIEWLEEHNGRLPRGQIRKKGIQLKTGEMTEEEKEVIKNKEMSILKKKEEEKKENYSDSYYNFPKEEINKVMKVPREKWYQKFIKMIKHMLKK